MKITLKQLRRAGACEGQVQLFKDAFGTEAEANEENARKMAQSFDWSWASDRLLTLSQREAYRAIVALAWEAYRAIQDPAMEAYRAIVDPAMEAYLAIQGPAWEAYRAIVDPAMEAYLAIQGPAWEAYNVARAMAFVAAINGEE
jgi:hypothetical protein